MKSLLIIFSLYNGVALPKLPLYLDTVSPDCLVEFNMIIGINEYIKDTGLQFKPVCVTSLGNDE